MKRNRDGSSLNSFSESSSKDDLINKLESSDDGNTEQSTVISEDDKITFVSSNIDSEVLKKKKETIEKEDESADETYYSNSFPQIPITMPRKWTAEEDDRLREAISKHGELNWRIIANYVGTRDNVQCLQRWQKVIRPGLIKGQWSAEEDKLLTYLVTLGFKNWGKLASHMPGRTSKQCRERWCHHLDPNVKKTEFTDEEDKIIMEVFKEVGNRWSVIAKHVPGRTENSIRSRLKILTSNANVYVAPKDLMTDMLKNNKEKTILNDSSNATNSSIITNINTTSKQTKDSNDDDINDPFQKLKALQKAVLLGLETIDNDKTNLPTSKSYNSNVIPIAEVSPKSELALNESMKSFKDKTLIDNQINNMGDSSNINPFHYQNMFNSMYMMNMLPRPSSLYPPNYPMPVMPVGQPPSIPGGYPMPMLPHMYSMPSLYNYRNMNYPPMGMYPNISYYPRNYRSGYHPYNPNQS